MKVGFQPTIAADWVDALPVELPRPEPVAGPLTAETLESFLRYNLSIPPFRTPELTSFANQLARTSLFNRWRPCGGRRFVLVDGSAHIGKTTAVVAVIASAIANHQPPMQIYKNKRVWPLPLAYVEGSSTGHGRAVAESICTFLSLPASRSEPAQTLVDRIAATARDLHLETVIIDDFHMLETHSKTQQDQLANTVKHLITAVPATFVIAGNDMDSHPLLQRTKRRGAAADQLRARADWVQFRPWPYGTEETDEAWIRLFGLLKRTVALPRGRTQWKLDHVATLREVQRCAAGQPSTATEWIITAANDAITDDVPLNLSVLRRTRATMEGRIR